MRTETLTWLKELSIEALQCRDLRHAWPRAYSRRAKSLDAASSDGITWQTIVSTKDGAPVELQREMLCLGGCGVVRVEEFRVALDGGLRRVGKPRYRHPRAYLRKREPDAPPLDAIDIDALRGIVVHRLYPNLAW